MSSPPIYTLGYANWSISEVEAQIDRLDALLVDVRYSPHTSKPGFAKSELDDHLGDRYLHVPAFGNENYKEGPIELADPERGLQIVQDQEGPFVLLCGCKDPEQCHRSTVATFLANRLGGAVEHLRAPGERAQPGLFDEETGT